ncbi:substrate-binding domain-containing protein, partial [Arthrobacter deserti]|nr:substrate-binding domain-containing protein [Arthrobacter deserti]
GAPDAIYCLTGRHARGVLEELKAGGIGVPGRTLLVAGSDSEQSRHSSPPITGIDLEPELVAAGGVERLSARAHGREVGEPERLRSRLVTRASTLPLPEDATS